MTSAPATVQPVLIVRNWHIAKIGGTGKIGRGRGIADMAGPAVGSTWSRLTQF